MTEVAIVDSSNLWSFIKVLNLFLTQQDNLDVVRIQAIYEMVFRTKSLLALSGEKR